MLNEAENAARRHGWVVVTETATAGLKSRLSDAFHRKLEELTSPSPRRRLTGASAAGISVTSQLLPERDPDWRLTVTALLEVLARHETGLLITIDEIHAVDRTDLTELAALVQHLIRENLPISLVMAGIPKAVSDLLNENVSTFLRRADRVRLRDVPLSLVQEALAQTFNETGIVITDGQLRQAAAATGGYPFLIQLVGYHVWRKAPDGKVTDESLAQGLTAAKKRLGSTVLEASLNGLSDVDKTFLLKMTEDDGQPSPIGDIARRLGATSRYAQVYRRRLLDQGIIAEAGRGFVVFAVPHLGQYLREHAAAKFDTFN
jgi:hypothetical protein